jgi:hypothetical protein
LRVRIALFDDACSTALARLGEAEYQSAFDAGATLPLDQITEFLLMEPPGARAYAPPDEV